MTFTVKDWKDEPDHTTPLSQAAIEDLEIRLSDYTDLRVNSVNVDEFGADPTGASDSVDAIADAAAAGKRVYLPGTYRVDTSATIPSETVFFGNGVSSAITAGAAVASPVVSFGRGNSSELRGLRIDADNSADVAVGIEGFNDGQIQRPVIADCQITGGAVAGLRFLGGYRGIFLNNQIYQNAIGIQIPDATDTYLDSLGQFDFISCWIHDNSAQGVLLNGAGQVNFHGGNIENNDGHGVEIQGIGGAFVYPVGFYGVHFEANGGDVSGIGLWSRDGVRSLTIEGGQFAASSLQSQGFKIESGTGYASINNVAIEGHGTKSTCAASAAFVKTGYVSGGADDGITVTGLESLYYSPEVDGWVDLSVVPQITADTTITVPQGVKLAEITGNTTIDNITFTRDGHHITLKFTGTPDVRHGVGNILLNGAGTFSATANDMLTLVYYDGWWRETARAVM